MLRILEATVQLEQPIQVVLQEQQHPWYTNPLFTLFVGFFVGMLSSVLIEYLRRFLFQPNLQAENCDQPGVVALTKVPGDHPGKHDAKYLRVAIRNRSWSWTTAKGCRAYLTQIEEWNANKYRAVDFFADTLRLRWAYEGEEGELHEGIDIPHGVLLHFDVFSTKNERTPAGAFEEHRIVQVANRGLRYDRERLMDKIEYGKRYRFHVLLVADGAPARPIQIAVEMGRNWQDFKVISEA